MQGVVLTRDLGWGWEGEEPVMGMGWEIEVD